MNLAIALTTTGTVSVTVLCNSVAIVARLMSEKIPVNFMASEIIDVASARRHFVRQVIDTDCTHILWLDQDIVIDSGDIMQLLEDHHECRVVGGLYRKRSIPHPPVVADILPEGFTPKFNFDMNGLTQVGGMGMGCCLVEMDVYREMSKHFNDDFWYVFDPQWGEDLWFFRRLHEMGIPAFLDGRVRAGHETMKLITVENGWTPEATVLTNGMR